MIQLKSLHLINFLSHVDTMIDFSENTGLTLIEGVNSLGQYSSNGAGKSTILEGIIYALTGDTLRGVSVNDVINRNYKKNTRVTLIFSQDNDIYEVTRYRKDEVYGDSLKIIKNDKDISKRVTKETQKSLDDILGISYKILVSTMLLGEGLSSRFTQLSDPEKKSLIESTLNLTYDMSKLRDKANTNLKSLKLQEATLNGEIATLESMRETDVEMIEDSIYDNLSCIEVYEKTLESLTSEIDRLNAQIESINPKLNILSDTLNKIDYLSKQYSDIMMSNITYEKEINRVRGGDIQFCSVCHQALNSDESKSSVIESYKVKINENLIALNSLKEQIDSLPDPDIIRDKYSQLSQEHSILMSTLRDLQKDYSEYQVKIAESKKDIESARSTLHYAQDCGSQLVDKHHEKEQVVTESKTYEYFYDLFSPTGIITSILSDAITYINTRLSTYSNVLLEKDYHIEFVKGKISLVDSKGASYQSLSNGEKRRLDIAIQFSLHDYVHMYCGLSMNIMFVDEVLDTLDDIGVDNIIEILRMKLDYCRLKSIYVITHNNSLKDKFDKMITIRKDPKGDSYLV